MITDGQHVETPDLAVIEIGSNAVRLIFFRDRKKLQIWRELCALGKTLEENACLWPEGKDRALDVLKKFKKETGKYAHLPVVAVATAALRDAKDGPDFIVRIREETGLEIRVLQGEDEARISALGVLSGGLGRVAVIGDLGGGSLEMTRTKDGKIVEGISFPLGTRRLQAAADAVQMIAQTLNVPESFSGLEFVALGGSWRALAEAYIWRSTGGGADIHGYAMAPNILFDFCDWLAGQDRAALEDLLKGSERGSDGLRNGALLLKTLVQKLDSPKIVFSGSGLREGLVAEFYGRIS